MVLTISAVTTGILSQPTRDIQEDFGGGVSTGLPATGDYNCVGVGDIDKDGYMDLVIGAEENYGTLGTTGLYAYFGNGQGTWTQHTISTTGSYAAIEIRDVDSDGNNEVFAGYQENTNGIGAWEWMGTQFQSSGISSPITSGNVNYFRIENISGSGGMDIAVARNGGIRYYEGSGSSPVSWTEYSSGLRTNGLCTSMDVNDLNNDGYLDMVVGQYGDGLFAYTQNPSIPSWNDETDTLPSVEHSGRILGLVTGDVNNDGNIDLIYSRRTSPTGLFLLLGNGGGTSGNDLRWTYLNNSWTSRPSGSFYQMNLADVDGDGDLDLLAAKEDNGLHLYLGDGSEDPGTGFTWTEVTDKGLPSNMKFYGSNYLDFDNDGDLDIAACTWGNGAMVFRNNETKPAEPIARAGRDISIFLGEEVLLDGVNSSDAQDCSEGDTNGDILTYDWNLTEQPSGSILTDMDLSPSDSSARPRFTPTHPGHYNFTLSVQDTDGYHSVAEDTISVLVILNNTSPVADAGEDLSVFTGDIAYLNGSGSYDNEESLELLSFSWSVNGSNPDMVILDDPTSMEPSFTAPDTIGIYRFSLIVTDSFNYSSMEDHVNVTVELRPNIDPTANAGEDLQGVANSSISLDGTGSSDSDGEIITWIWNCTSHQDVTITNSNSSTPEFTPNISGVYTFSLEVKDNRGGMSDPDSVLVTITPDNFPPTANAGKNMTVNRNSTVFLNGTLSRDPEGNIEFWDWVSTSHPGLELNNSNSSNPNFNASELGEYHFRLRVKDNRGMWSNWDSVKVTVVEEDVNITEPVENTLPEILLHGINVGEVVAGDVTISWEATDEDEDPLSIRIELESVHSSDIHILYEQQLNGTYSWGGVILKTTSYENGSYGIKLIVTDGFDHVIQEISPFEIRNEPEINTTVDDDDEEPIIEDPEPQDENEDDEESTLKPQMIIAIIIIAILLLLLLFGIGKRIYDRTEDDEIEDFEE